MTSSKQIIVAAITRTEALTRREAVAGKCVHTQELSPHRIRSLQDSASTSSTAWTMATITIALAISDVACIANMERTHGSCSFASDDWVWSFDTEKLLHTASFNTEKHSQTAREAFTQRSFYTEKFLHRSFYTQKLLHRKGVYTQKLLHREAFIHRSFYRQKLLHRASFYTEKLLQRNFNTKKLLQTEAFTHRSFYTEKLLHTENLLHTEAFTQRIFYTEKPLHREVFTHRSF